MYGPTLAISKDIHQTKYRLDGESFEQAMYRIADALADGKDHYHQFKDILLEQRFLPAGRVQNAMGSPRETTAYNCFVSGVIEDSTSSIMARATDAFETMRRGGGIGYDFSRLRPRGDLIATLGSRASGPISFMGIYDAICGTVASAGHRRGAQMGVLRVDHPDIEEFVRAKQNSDTLTRFNVSLGITDRFMECLRAGEKFPLEFGGRVYRYIDPKALWNEVMRGTWDWAEPGCLFLDTINRMNNLHYCETIEATNPCGEQPLPPFGACLLGSFNLVKYVKMGVSPKHTFMFDWNQFQQDIAPVVRAMDNVIDRTIYPLPEQEREAKAKRRMGLGVTGLANAAELLGHPYASPGFLEFEAGVLSYLRTFAYWASVDLAAEKGSFPLYDEDKYLEGAFIKTLPEDIPGLIAFEGIRNSHLTSIAPTGTISLSADNVSSGIEPPFSMFYDRTIQTFEGPRVERVEDYAYRMGVKGVTADETPALGHLEVLATAQRFTDSAVSKTCNVGAQVTFDEFKELYTLAWEKGCKGITTFRAAGKRYGVLNVPEDLPAKQEPEGGACFFDPETGKKACDQ